MPRTLPATGPRTVIADGPPGGMGRFAAIRPESRPSPGKTAGYLPHMEQRISLITLGVGDVGRARAFYERLGWQGQELEETVFFQAGGAVLVLWGRDKLARDCGIAEDAEGSTGGQTGGFSGVALAHNVRSRAEVDGIIAAAQRAGATITRPAAETFYGGYAGVFTDLDGHVWEIAHNPGFSFAEDGSLILPDFGSP
nr:MULTISPECIES: VOC family protein [Protofrankia]